MLKFEPNRNIPIISLNFVRYHWQTQCFSYNFIIVFNCYWHNVSKHGSATHNTHSIMALIVSVLSSRVGEG